MSNKETDPMCVAMIGDHYTEKWRGRFLPTVVQEFDDLCRDVQEMKALLLRAKAYDAANGEPDCEMDQKKVALLKLMAELAGVELSDVLD